MACRCRCELVSGMWLEVGTQVRRWMTEGAKREPSLVYGNVQTESYHHWLGGHDIFYESGFVNNPILKNDYIRIGSRTAK